MPDIDISAIKRVPLSCEQKLLSCIDYSQGHLGVPEVVVFMLVASAVGLFAGWLIWKKG